MGLSLGALAVTSWLGAQGIAQQITELDFVARLTIQSEVGSTNQIQYTNHLSPSNWAVLATVVVTQSPYTYLDLSAPSSPRRFYRVVDPHRPPAPAGMVWIPAGTFIMGSPTNEVERNSNEVQHSVTLSGFYLSRYETRQAEYLAVVGNNPSFFNGDRTGSLWPTGTNYGTEPNRPVEQVSWFDATNYCHRLNLREGRLGSGWVYRLPTEAEWEYACRAGTTTPFHYGSNLVSGMANFYGLAEYVGGVGTLRNPNGIYLGRTALVGSYAPNAWGLHDMHGNVSEWCWDRWGDYPTGSVVNPAGGPGPNPVVRGLSWYDTATDCRSANRDNYWLEAKFPDIGFRTVLARE